MERVGTVRFMTTPNPPSPPLPYPDRTRLVHIGPHKTGTTTVQAAFHAARHEASRQGVHVAGRTRHPMAAVLAATARPAPNSKTNAPPSRAKWTALLHEIRTAREPRVVLSSEFFADARPDAIARVTEELDPSRVQIAVTLRPLAKIIPSQWQQYVQNGLRVDFDQWLEAIFGDQPDRVTPTFWHRHRHDRLVRRWADAVGADRLTVIVVDDRDHDGVLRTFEQLLGLTDGLLVADRDLSNRSMTLPEIEVVRAFNQQYAKTQLGRAVYSKAMRFGAALRMKEREPAPTEQRLTPPQWAMDRAGEVSAEMVADIRSTGVRVIGDLDLLTETPAGWADGERPPVEITPEVAGRAAMGVLESLLSDAVSTDGKVPTSRDALLEAIPARELAEALIERVTAKVGTVLRRGSSE